MNKTLFTILMIMACMIVFSPAFIVLLNLFGLGYSFVGQPFVMFSQFFGTAFESIFSFYYLKLILGVVVFFFGMGLIASILFGAGRLVIKKGAKTADIAAKKVGGK